MKLQEVRERMIGLANGGVVTDDIRQSVPYLNNIAVTFRAVIIREKYLGTRDLGRNRRLDAAYYYKHYPLFSPSMQDDNCCVKFDCPEPLTFDEQSNGLRYVGTIDGTCGYDSVASRSKLSDINHHPVFRAIMDNETGYLYDGFRKAIEIYGNENIEEILIEMIAKNPLECSGWNIEEDAFIADEDIDRFLAINFRNQLNIERTSPEDALSKK